MRGVNIMRARGNDLKLWASISTPSKSYQTIICARYVSDYLLNCCFSSRVNFLFKVDWFYFNVLTKFVKIPSKVQQNLLLYLKPHMQTFSKGSKMRMELITKLKQQRKTQKKKKIISQEFEWIRFTSWNFCFKRTNSIFSSPESDRMNTCSSEYFFLWLCVCKEDEKWARKRAKRVKMAIWIRKERQRSVARRRI